MPDTIRHRVQRIMQQRIAQTETVDYADLRDHVLRHYPDLFPPESDDVWDRWQRDEVMRAVQQIFEDMT